MYILTTVITGDIRRQIFSASPELDACTLTPDTA